MTNETDHKSIEDLVVSTTIQFDTLYRVLIGKGIFTEPEFHEKLKKVQASYQNRSRAMNYRDNHDRKNNIQRTNWCRPSRP